MNVKLELPNRISESESEGYIFVADICNMCRCSTETARNYIIDSGLPRKRFRRRVAVPKKAFMEWLDGRTDRNIKRYNANKDVRIAAKKFGVKLWEVADWLNVSEPTITRLLRRELPLEEKGKMLDAIIAIRDSRGTCVDADCE